MPDHGLGYIGGMTAMLYIKYDQAGDFSIHSEQAWFPFGNFCHQGVGIWYAMSPQYEPQLVRYCNDVGIKMGLFDSRCDLTSAPASCAKAFLRARCLMPDPVELQQEYGILVQRFEQEAGDAVVGHGGWWHWGTAATSLVVNEAINAAPVWWLTQGLPQLVDFIRTELSPYLQLWHAYKKLRLDAGAMEELWQADQPTLKEDGEEGRSSSSNSSSTTASSGGSTVEDIPGTFTEDDFAFPSGITPTVAALLFTDEMATAVSRLVPVAWLKGFIRVVLYHLRTHLGAEQDTRPRSSRDELVYEFKAAHAAMDFSSLLHEQLHVAAAQLDCVFTWLGSSMARQIERMQSE